MVFVSNYERIQQRLHTEATTGPFYAITTNVETKLKTVDAAVAIAPRNRKSRTDDLYHKFRRMDGYFPARRQGLDAQLHTSRRKCQEPRRIQD